MLMIVYAYVLTQLWFPSGLVDQAKKHGEKAQQSEGMDMDHGMRGSLRDKLLSREGWQRIAQAFFMEWKVVRKEILFGFTIVGFISAIVPQSFWNPIFLIGGGGAQSRGFLIMLENALVAPVVPFFTRWTTCRWPRCCGRAMRPSAA